MARIPSEEEAKRSARKGPTGLAFRPNPTGPPLPEEVTASLRSAGIPVPASRLPGATPTDILRGHDVQMQKALSAIDAARIGDVQRRQLEGAPPDIRLGAGAEFAQDRLSQFRAGVPGINQPLHFESVRPAGVVLPGEGFGGKIGRLQGEFFGRQTRPTPEQLEKQDVGRAARHGLELEEFRQIRSQVGPGRSFRDVMAERGRHQQQVELIEAAGAKADGIDMQGLASIAQVLGVMPEGPERAALSAALAAVLGQQAGVDFTKKDTDTDRETPTTGSMVGGIVDIPKGAAQETKDIISKGNLKNITRQIKDKTARLRTLTGRLRRGTAGVSAGVGGPGIQIPIGAEEAAALDKEIRKLQKELKQLEKDRKRFSR